MHSLAAPVVVHVAAGGEDDAAAAASIGGGVMASSGKHHHQQQHEQQPGPPAALYPLAQATHAAVLADRALFLRLLADCHRALAAVPGSRARPAGSKSFKAPVVCGKASKRDRLLHAAVLVYAFGCMHARTCVERNWVRRGRGWCCAAKQCCMQRMPCASCMGAQQHTCSSTNISLPQTTPPPGLPPPKQPPQWQNNNRLE